MLLGDPGAGKTVMMRDACLHALASFGDPLGAMPEGLEPLAGRLPLLIELRNYVAAQAAGHCGSFLEYAHYLGESEGYGLNSLDLGQYLAGEPSLLVLDGLDEVLEPGVRAKIIEEIIGLAHEYPNARIVVTSRIQGYRPDPLAAAGFHHATLQELSDEQVQTFIRGWFAAVFPNAPADAEERVNRVRDALQGSPPLRTLAGNPLLLTMIALVARNQELPRERARLYEHALGVLVFNWDMTGKYLKSADLPAGFQDRRSKLDLLRWIAWHMSQDKERLASNVISGEHLERTIRDHLESIHWQMKPADSRPLASAIVRQLHQRNFVLCLQGPDLYGFVHRTFLEYLIAEEYVKRVLAKDGMPLEDLAELFRKRADDDRWREILRLICGLIDEERAAVLIETLLPKRWGINRPNQMVLPIQCLAEITRPLLLHDTCCKIIELLFRLINWKISKREESILRLLGVLDKQTENLVVSISNLEGRWRGANGKENWLKLTGKTLMTLVDDFLIVRMSSLLWKPSKEVKNALHYLLSSDAPHDRRFALTSLYGIFCHKDFTLSLYLDDPYESVRCTALRLLAETASIAEPSIAELLERRAVEDVHQEVRIQALKLLAGKRANDAATSKFLRERALEDPHGEVRANALELLVSKWATDPMTGELLRERAAEDPHEKTRVKALELLSKDWADDPKTAAFLQERSVKDAHEEVRAKALEFLMEKAGDDLATIEFLKIWAVKDAHGEVRAKALELLAENGGDDPEIFEILQRRGVEDPHEAPRKNALWRLASQWADHPETADFIRERASEDPHPSVRSTAVSQLYNFRDDVRTVTLLRRRAVEDEEGDVRGEALRLFSNCSPCDTVVRDFLRTRALEDTRPYPRQKALDALAEHWREEPETAALIRHRAVEDGHEYVRAEALDLLIRYWGDDPNALELLRRRAFDDGNKSPRSIAFAGWALRREEGNRAEALRREFNVQQREAIDPREPIGRERLEATADVLMISLDEARRLYEGLAADYGLTLAFD